MQKLEFSSKYHEEAFPDRYASKHGESFSRRLNDRREQALLGRALARVGEVTSVADIGCGPGRFWPTISAASAAAELYGSDVSESMLRYARDRFADGLGARFGLASGSVTSLPFADAAFDCVISMRLLHHFGEPADRLQAIRELARVTNRYLIVSLWTDGVLQALPLGSAVVEVAGVRCRDRLALHRSGGVRATGSFDTGFQGA